MKKLYTIGLTVAFIYLFSSASGQITGSDTVCSGFIYNYKVNIPGAVSFTWYLPTGWYFFNGQGTDSVSVNCNDTVGNICVAGFDTSGHKVDSLCKQVYWGTEGPAWSVGANPISCCPYGVSITLSIVFSGPICGNGSCGNGTPNPNVVYAAFDNPWPTGNYLGIVNGSNIFSNTNISAVVIYVYLVDITFGFNNIILVKGGNGCTPNNTIEIQGIPFADVFVSASPNPACYGDTITASAFVQYPNCSTSSFTRWLSNLPMIVNYGGPNTATFIMNDSTGVAEIDYAFCDQYTNNNTYCCWSGSAYVTANICAKPIASFISNKTAFCLGSNNCVTYTDQSFRSPNQWQWTFQGGTPSSSTNENPSICYSASGVYPVSLIASNNYGSDTITFSNYITVNPMPVISINPDTSICEGSGVQLSSNGGESYLWSPATGLSNNNISNPFASPITTTTYTLTVTDSNGCSANDSVKLKVNPLPIINAGSDTSLCLGASAQLTAFGGVSYVWSPSAGLNDSTISNPLASPSTTTHYVIQVTDSNLCKSSDSIEIIVNPLPVVGLNADTSLCFGSSIQLNATGGNEYSWNPGVWLSDSTISNPVATSLTTTTYTVNVTDGNGCTGSGSVTLSTYPETPTPSIKQVGNTLYCSTDTAYISFQWYADTTLVAGATDTAYVATHNGNYNVEVTDRNGCKLSAGINVVINNIADVKENFVTVYPNPVTNQLTIYESQFTIKEVEIYNTLGQILYKSDPSAYGRNPKSEIIMDVSDFAQGVYFVQVSDGTQRFVSKFVKE